MDVSKWKLFKIGEIFNCSTTKALKTNEIVEGNIVYITRSTIRNVCSKLVSNVENKIERGNCITIGAEGAVAFYQKDEFLPGVKVYTLRNDYLNENNALFVCTMINKSCYKYSYSRARVLSAIKAEYVLLPANGEDPSWDEMSDYIESLKEKVNKQFDKLLAVTKGDANTLKNFSGKVDANDFNEWAFTTSKSSLKLDLNKWREYKIGDLFTTYTGGDLIISNVEEGNIPIVSHSASRNSVSIFSSEIPGKKLFDCSKVIALADRGTFFATIQKEDFYIGTRVKALESKYDNITKHILMFIATIINNEAFRFTYGRNCTGGLDSLKISLPTKFDSTGRIFVDSSQKFSKNGYVPDWDYMDQYIKHLPYSDRI